MCCHPFSESPEALTDLHAIAPNAADAAGDNFYECGIDDPRRW